MISTFSFYKIAPIVAINTHIVLRPHSYIGQNKVAEIPDVRHPDEMDFQIKVPHFDQYDAVSLAESDGKWYQIVERGEVTRDEEHVRFTLRYDPLMSHYTSESEMTAIWKKLPYADKRARRGTVLDESNLIEERKDALSIMEYQDTRVLPVVKKYQMFWVEITTSCSLLGSISSDHTSITTVDNRTALEKSVNQQSAMFKYGFFALYDKGNYTPRIQICNETLGFTLKEWWKNNGNFEQHDITTYPLFYPSIDDVINDSDEVLGIPTDAILDVSITAWCPYEYRNHLKTESGVTYSAPFLYNASQTLYPYIIRNALIQTTPTDYGVANKHPRHIAMYELGTPNESYFVRDAWGSHTLSLTSDEYVCGEVNLRDANGNVIANIPRDYFEWNSLTSRWELGYKAQTYSDTTGLYTRVDIGKDVPHIITFPEGKLPYIGDAWAQYRIREMSYDRQALENAKEQAWLQFGVGVAESVASGSMTYALGRVGQASSKTAKERNTAAVYNTASGIIGSAINTYLSIRASEQEQELTEGRQKGACGTGYNTGYGISYCDNALDIGAGFVVMMPSRFDPTDAHEKGMYYGYNAEFLGGVTFDVDGYYEGVPKLDPVTYNLKEEEMSRLTEMFLTGIRIQKV